MPPAVPACCRLYVFGDAHGRSDLLARLCEAIEQDRSRSPVERAVVIGLGDYIDRGDDSRGVVEALAGGFLANFELVALRGNHEQLLLEFLEDPRRNGRLWFQLGGLATLASYGLNLQGRHAERPELLRDALVTALPVEHLLFLQATPLFLSLGDYFFVHAGVRIGVPLGAQRAEDLLWIRSGFADSDPKFEQFIVHGHTPVAKPEIRSGRINIDTGAYATGRLTCLVLEGHQRRFLDI